ncbi:hypothetical protein N431DRAFT_463023 [Stipitochalara longipes BDJ]|nr:hypothetical protein N431DRAFT_463023 [Stipitochalara longipes BDJ]
MLIAHTSYSTFTMNSEADSAPYFHLASPPRSPGGSPILPISQRTLLSTNSPTGVSNGPAYSTAINPTLSIKALNVVLAFFAFVALILGENGHRSNGSFALTEVFLVSQSMWNNLMIARHYLRDPRRHENEADEKKIRYVNIGLIVGLVLSLSVGYLILSGPMEWYYSDWTWFWGCSLVWIVVIGQTIVVVYGQKLDKKRLNIRIGLEESVEA